MNYWNNRKKHENGDIKMDRINVVEVRMNGRQVGRLAMTPEGLCAFEYSAQFLPDAFSISPFELPLRRGVTIAKPRPFDGGFGVFDNSLPDGWGALVLDRYLQKQGINPRTLTLLDRLSLVGSYGRGALEFYPDRSVMNDTAYMNFERLAEEAERIFGSDEYNGEGIDEFIRRGGSPGGARPKIFTRYDEREWLVKFRAKYDPQNIGETEYRYSLIARQCGIEMPETRLFEGKYFGVERFDRTPGGKLHVVSLAGLLGADYRTPCIDYTHIFQAASILTHSVKELWKIYRLMVFNFLIGNKDDHAKNFAFLHTGEAWQFAPAYDLLPSDGMNGYHTTSINDRIEPTKDDLLVVAVNAGLDKRHAVQEFDRIETIVRQSDK